ncbi:hypothetical protein C8J55DRAFT_556485 [Lentinula edodes]|uniref:Uncharacterized protein n=1 Tax=Lentinula lateritia TaxID=40482 RepID=A0A9W9AXN0_9AGAR|nr:hypothetical protein C8J55DRAFT_556485 [Lentinula edodes]
MNCVYTALGLALLALPLALISLNLSDDRELQGLSLSPSSRLSVGPSCYRSVTYGFAATTNDAGAFSTGISIVFIIIIDDGHTMTTTPHCSSSSSPPPIQTTDTPHTSFDTAHKRRVSEVRTEQDGHLDHHDNKQHRQQQTSEQPMKKRRVASPSPSRSPAPVKQYNIRK